MTRKVAIHNSIESNSSLDRSCCVSIPDTLDDIVRLTTGNYWEDVRIERVRATFEA